MSDLSGVKDFQVLVLVIVCHSLVLMGELQCGEENLLGRCDRGVSVWLCGRLLPVYLNVGDHCLVFGDSQSEKFPDLSIYLRLLLCRCVNL